MTDFLSAAMAPKDSDFNVRINSEIKNIVIMDLKRAEERADKEGWLNADDLERELGGVKSEAYSSKMIYA
ncbi:MAG: hypothetical protein ACI4EJ_01745 [Bacteroides sp.]